MTTQPGVLPVHDPPGTERTEVLEHLARRVADLGPYRPDLSARAARLVERIATQSFHIAVLGEFKRGKSTLVNALIGRPLLPTGVVPLTMVPTEVHFGSPETTVVFLDGRRLAIAPSEIGEYGTETGNPLNRRQVLRIEVGTDSNFGVPGVVLVDTPGVASVNVHNTAAAHDALLDADGAVVVFSADSPLSTSEEALVAELGRRRARVFAVINKCDHLTPDELDEVRVFVTEHLRRLVGDGIEPFCVSARLATDATATMDQRDDLRRSFMAFRAALDSFVTDDLAAARSASTIGEMQRLGATLGQSLILEEAAAALDLDTLTLQVGRFEEAATEGSRQLKEDWILLDHDVAALASEVGEELAAEAARAAQERRPMLAARTGTLAFRQLDGGLRDAIEEAVHEGFEPLRRVAQDRAERSWTALATRFGSRVQARVDELRTVAGALFDVHVPAAPIPEVGAQPSHFSYHFLQVESPGALIGRSAKVLLPTGQARRRAVRRAERKLTQEFDKHAGRARYDISERLNQAKVAFVAEMNREFAQTQASILEAIARSKSAHAQTESDQSAQRQLRRRARSIVDDIEAVVAGSSRGPGDTGGSG